MREATTAQRLKQLMDERNLKQIDILNATLPFAERNGIKMNKSDISQYVSGKVEPGQDKLMILSQALNVDPVWLMGFSTDVETLSTHEWAMSKLQMYLKNYDSVLYMLGLSEQIDDDANTTLQNLEGSCMDVTPAKRIDLLLALTKEANSFVRRNGKAGINDVYDRLDDHGKALVDAIIELEAKRLKDDPVRT